MNTVPFIITVIGGILVLLSYYLVFRGSKRGYLDSKYWLGQPKSVVKVLFILQLVSVIGFFLFMPNIKTRDLGNEMDTHFNQVITKTTHLTLLFGKKREWKSSILPFPLKHD